MKQQRFVSKLFIHNNSEVEIFHGGNSNQRSCWMRADSSRLLMSVPSSHEDEILKMKRFFPWLELGERGRGCSEHIP